MEEVFQTLVTNMASFAQNVQIQTTNERILQPAATVQRVAELNNGQPRRPEFKMDPPTFSGKGDFREWKRKIELIYEVKGLTRGKTDVDPTPPAGECSESGHAHKPSNLSRAHDSSHHEVHCRK